MITPANKILIGVDFSEGSRAALSRGMMMAHKTGFSVDVLHVLNNFFYKGGHDPAGSLDVSQEIEEKISEALQKFVNETISGDFDLNTEVVIGIPDQEILQYAEKQKAAVTLLGSQGEGGIENLLLGRVSESLAAHAKFPVWIEREKNTPEFKEMILTTDLSPHSRKGVAEGLNWAERMGSKAVVVHVLEVPYFPPLGLKDPVEFENRVLELANKDLEKFLNDLPATKIPIEPLILKGHLIVELEKLIQRRNSDLVVITKHGATTPVFKPIGSNAAKILRHAPCSVLVVP